MPDPAFQNECGNPILPGVCRRARSEAAGDRAMPVRRHPLDTEEPMINCNCQ
jgi:hypothetical protein